MPAGQHVAACKALAYLGLALSVTAIEPDDPCAITVEEGLAILTRADGVTFGIDLGRRPC